MTGKGSKPRPLSVSRKKFEENFERIFAKQNADDDYDPTPLCHGCGAMTASSCDCPDSFFAKNH